jgi:putative ABC transport system permease protein
MLPYHFKIAWRNILKRKFSTLLNILALSLGISCCILVFLYVNYQLNFDRYHNNTDRLFRLVYELRLDQTDFDKGSSIAMLKSLKNEFPQVEKATVSINRQSLVIDVEGDRNRRFREDGNITFTNADWFDVFSYTWLEGGPASMSQPGSVILTQKIAAKYFGDERPTGKIISIAGKQFKVAGLIADPANTDMKGEIYISLSSFAKLYPKIGADYFTSWGYTMSTHDAFVLLKDADQKGVVERRLMSMVDQNMGEGMSKWYSFQLMPFDNMHFDMRYAGTISKSFLTTLGIIGFLILTIAAINYINLVVAQQTKRKAEIGTRKILGGSVNQIFFQFISESFLVALIAVLCSVSIIILIIPQLNIHIFYEEPIQILSFVELLIFSVCTLLFLTLSAGIYPSYIMSRILIFSTKESARKSNHSNTARSLIIIQNVAAQILIIGTVIVLLQVHFLKNTDKGFDRNSVVMIPFEKISEQQRHLLSQGLKSISGVQSFSFCYQSPGSDTRRGATIKYDDRAEWEAGSARFSIGDSAYFKTFGIPLKSGRTISPTSARPEYLVNETMSKSLEPKNPGAVIGKTLMAGEQEGTIIGITGDFNLKSLRNLIEPVVFMDNDFLIQNLAVKLVGANTTATLDRVKEEYEAALPDQLFSFQFLDDRIAQLYKRESLQQKFIWIASAVAITISSLGLLGLISLQTVQRTKEIGIRKVLGATVTQITLLLSSEFIMIILISFVMASPIAYWLMDQWLQDFAYRINIEWWIFALSGTLAVLIALITVSFQAIKAAMGNPAESLKSE